MQGLDEVRRPGTSVPSNRGGRPSRSEHRCFGQILGEGVADLVTEHDPDADAEVDGKRFDGIDLFLSLPHTDIDSSKDDLKQLADQVGEKNLVIGSLVAPVWTPTGGGSAPGAVRIRPPRSNMATATSSAPYCSAACIGVQPYSSAGEPGAAPARSSSRTNSQPPMFAGSSWTHTSRSAFG